MTAQEFVTKLDRVKPAGDRRWQAICPGHADGTPSLSVMSGTGGNILLHCHAGCEVSDILAAMGLTFQDLFQESRDGAQETQPPDRWPITATYVYEDESAKPVYRVLRRTSQDSGKKTFRQERSDGRGGWIPNMDGVKRVLFGLPKLLDRETSDDVVFLCEGERDCEALWSIGAVATTNPGGADKWLPDYSTTLAGRDVVILPDNDDAGEKHAAKVAAALDGISKSVKTLRLPGLPVKGDVSDWIGRGGSLGQLQSLAARVTAGACFMPSTMRLVGERERRLENAGHTLKFGISFLDDAFGGITRNDLVLVGARYGTGKTKLVTHLAATNCREGKKIHLFALEAEDDEIERRMKYEHTAAAYFRSGRMHTAGIRYIDWYRGKLDDELGQFEREAEPGLHAALKNLYTYYRVDSFTGADFVKQLAAVSEETSGMILDHFHYIDTDGTDQNENRAQKNVTKLIRDQALRSGVPVILVGQIHKTKESPRFAPLVPNGEAFHGSSDLVKIATKGVMIAPDYTTETGHPCRWSTFMRIVKCRQESALERYVAKMVYDTRTDSYAPEYTLGRLVKGDTEFEALAISQWPSWYRNSAASDGRPTEAAEEVGDRRFGT